MSDRENQKDEIEVLQSIFTEEEFQSLKNGDLISGQFNAFVSVPEKYTMCYGENFTLLSPKRGQTCETNENMPDKKTVSLQYLPPIELSFSLPHDYPSQTPPKFTIMCRWLTWGQLTKLCQKLDQIWEENRGYVVLYLWAQFLKDECLPFLGLEKSLDITNITRNALMYEARALRRRAMSLRGEDAKQQASTSTSSKHNENSRVLANISNRKKENVCLDPLSKKELEKQANEVKSALYESKCAFDRTDFDKQQSSKLEEALRVKQSLYESVRGSAYHNTEKMAEDSKEQALRVKRSLYGFSSSPGEERHGESSQKEFLMEEGSQEAERVRQSLYETGSAAEVYDSREADTLEQVLGHPLYGFKLSKNDSTVKNEHCCTEEGLKAEVSLLDSSVGDEHSYEAEENQFASPESSQPDAAEAGPSSTKERNDGVARYRPSRKYNGRNASQSRKGFHRGCKTKSRSVDSRIISGTALSEPLWKIIIDYNKQRKRKDLNYQMFCCAVCYEDKIGSQCMQLDNCGHVFCRECLSSYLDVSIKEGKVRQLTCLEKDCDTDFLQSEIKSLVSPELFVKYDSLLLASTLDTLNVTYCPRRFCQYPVSPESDNMAVCPQCQYCFCLYCKMVYHGVEPCRFKLDSEQTKALVKDYESCSGARKEELERKYGRKYLRQLTENVLSDTWRLNHSKQCPTCNASIQRTYGCNKMVCLRCSTNFCWLCLATLEPSNPYDHFQSGRCANKLFFGVVEDEEEIEDIEEEEEEDFSDLDDDDIFIDYGYALWA